MTDTLTHPASAPETASLRSLLYTAAIAPLNDLGWIAVTGDDRVRWLNGMVTNSIQGLAAGEGCFNLLLNAQGRIQGTATAFAPPDRMLLETDRIQVDTLLTLLDRFIIMDDVELAVTTRTGLSLIGPKAPALLAALNVSTSDHAPSGSLKPLELIQVTWHGHSLDLIHAHSPLVPRFELWTDPATSTLLAEQLRSAGALDVGKETLEALRLLEGTPRFGTDIRDTALPQEINQPHALHFAKGCYLGQEIVERIRSRGQVHRTLHGFRLEGDLPSTIAPLTVEGKPVGELTSAAAVLLPSGNVTLALGTVRREALTSAMTYPAGQAYPITLPYAITSI